MKQHISPDVVSWAFLISACGVDGQVKKALSYYEAMLGNDIQPDDKLYTSVLNACSHSGNIAEAEKLFKDMTTHGISPNAYHYTCLVDTYARAGKLDNAERVLLSMQEPHPVPWRALMGACRIHNDTIRAVRAATMLYKLDPEDASPYILLSNLYSANGNQEKSKQVVKLMEERRVKKPPGKSHIYVDGKLYSFTVDEQEYDFMERIHARLDKERARITEENGYIPDLSCVARDFSTNNEKVKYLWKHSEKLAIAWGMLNTPEGTTLSVTKDLRMCLDCHTATKLLSNHTTRKIKIRDASRWHTFENGRCSCGDLY
jgi:pentatricopeptide repeat protein